MARSPAYGDLCGTCLHSSGIWESCLCKKILWPQERNCIPERAEALIGSQSNPLRIRVLSGLQVVAAASDMQSTDQPAVRLSLIF